MCISNWIVCIWLAWSNVFNCTYPGTKSLNSYPTFKEVSTEWKPCPWDMCESRIARAHARSTGSAEMQAIRRRLWLLLPRKLAPVIVYNHQFSGMTTTEWLQPLISGTSHNDTAATKSFSIPNSLNSHSQTQFAHAGWFGHFTHMEEFPLHPVHGRVSTSHSTPTEESLHSTAKKYWCLIWC